VQDLEQVIIEGRARLLGAVRQEVLYGIKPAAEFLRLREQLRSFPDVTLEIEDYGFDSAVRKTNQEDEAEKQNGFINLVYSAGGIQGSGQAHLLRSFTR